MSRKALPFGLIFWLSAFFLTLRPAFLAAQTPQNLIFFYSPDKTYQPGRAVTLYLYFFRLADPMPFFRSWDEALQSTPSFEIIQKHRLSALSERLIDASGYPEDRYHVLYRLRLLPKRDLPTLSYGPLQYRAARSSVISWSKVQASGGPAEQIRFSAALSTPSARLGQPVSLRVSVECPSFLCDYGRFDRDDLTTFLRTNLRLSKPPDIAWEQASVSPQISEDTSRVPSLIRILWDLTLFPLRPGSFPPFQASLELPILETMEDGSAVRQIQSWLQTQGIAPSQASRLIQLQNERSPLTSRIQLSTQTSPLQSLPVQGCPGLWDLSSRIVRLDDHPSPLWEIRLTGRGLFLLAKDAFYRSVESALAPLQSRISLVHSVWKLHDGQASGRSEIALFFSFPSNLSSLPSLSLDTSLPSGQIATKTTPPLSTSSPPVRLPEATAILPAERRIYLLSQAPLSPSSDTPLRSFGYRIPEGFPSQALLRQGLSISEPLHFQRIQKMKDIVRRHSNQGGGFGMFIQINSQTRPIPVEAASFQARLPSGIFTSFPVVEWAGQRFAVHRLTESGFSVSAHLSQTRLLVGESLDYSLSLRCPSNDCPPQSSDLYKPLFRSSLSLPPFDKYSHFRLLDDFKRSDALDGTTSFLYRVRFKTTESGTLRIPPATLRLPSEILHDLYNKHRICLFRGGGPEDRLLDAIVRDHLAQESDPQCSLGTQEISTASLEASVSPLPPAAAGIQLVGSFRISARLTDLAFPTKYASTTDKPFFLIVEISGQGDLQAAREILRDQLDRLGQDLRRQGVTTYTETSRDPDTPHAATRLQLQLIPEQPGRISIPSLSLRYFHRDEGILNAQTLPLSVLIEPREGRPSSSPSVSTPPPSRPSDSLLQDTDLRPLQILSSLSLPDQSFSPFSWASLAFFFSSPLAFLLFFAWHRLDRRRSADPLRQTQEQAYRRASKDLALLDLSSPQGPRLALQILQRYTAERLRSPGLQLTSHEIRLRLSSLLPDLPPPVTLFLQRMHSLEDSLYGGSPILEPSSFLRSLDAEILAFDRSLPKEVA